MTGGQNLATELSPGGLHFCEPLIHSISTFPYIIPLVCYDSTPGIFPTPRKHKNSHGIPYVGGGGWGEGCIASMGLN